jgi:cytochrome c-type biogenesis protein CcmE
VVTEATAIDDAERGSPCRVFSNATHLPFSIPKDWSRRYLTEQGVGVSNDRGARMNIRLVIGIILVLPILAHFGYAAAASPAANYYITVDEYVGRTASGNTNARVGGQVIPGTILWDNATRTMRFQVAGDNSELGVIYRGPVPDSFRDGVTAIIEGNRGQNGAFVASSITVKCPHQYLPAS